MGGAVVRRVLELRGRARGRVAVTGFLAGVVTIGCLAAVAVSPRAAVAVPSGSSAAVMYAWGNGPLGDGTNSGSAVPVPVQLPGGVAPTAVSAGYGTSLAIGSDGNVYAWGSNEYGALGDGIDADSQTPVRVQLPGGVSAAAVSEGLYASLALGSNGLVYAWGSNEWGQLGDGSATGPEICGYWACSPVPVPVPLPGGVTATAVAEAGGTSYAVGSNGTLYSWGDNYLGMLGVGSTTGPDTCDGGDCSTTPVAVALPGGFAAVAVSGNDGTVMALGSDGSVYDWGNNFNGELGDGTTSTDSPVPVRVSLPAGVTAAALPASGAGLVLGSDGNAYQWGAVGMNGGNVIEALTPEQVPLPDGVAATAVAGGTANYILGSNGNLYAWGDNTFGEYGNGTVTESSTPVQVTLGGGIRLTAVSSGNYAALAIGNGETPVIATATGLTGSPTPAIANVSPVTLTATVTAADGSHPAGSVQLEVDGTNFGQPAPVNAKGVATFTEGAFAGPGTVPLSAVFTPDHPTAYAGSAGTFALTEVPPPPLSGAIPLAVQDPPAGTFTLTVDTTDTVTLAASGNSAAAATTPIIVTDTRNTFPGWAVYGQDSTFTGSGTAAGATIPAGQLGWTPTSTGPLPQGVTLGPPASPVNPGLGAAPDLLASVRAGTGNGTGATVLGANLTLLIPAAQPAGPYTGTLTITAVNSQP